MVDVVSAIDAAIARAMPQRMDWGRDNCAFWPADILRVATGIDFAAWFRGRFTTPIGARRALKTYAGGGMPETMEVLALEHGWPEIAPSQTLPGDIGLVGEALLICAGPCFVGREDPGVGLVPSSMVVRAWRVVQCPRS